MLWRRQLEFIFRDADSLTSILSPRERRTTKSPGEGQIFRPTRDVDLNHKHANYCAHSALTNLREKSEWNGIRDSKVLLAEPIFAKN